MERVDIGMDVDYPFLLSFEEHVDIQWGQRTFQQWWVMVMCSSILLYLTFVFVGRKIMEERAKFGLRGPLFIWNLSLTIFSSLGALRSVQELCHVISAGSYFASITDQG